jgi:hypothetical protein
MNKINEILEKLKAFFENAKYEHEPITMGSMGELGGILRLELEDKTPVQVRFGESLFFIKDEEEEIMHAYDFNFSYRFSVENSEYEYYL